MKRRKLSCYCPYSKDNLPTGGNAKKLWYGLILLGFNVVMLWYNPNCWGHKSGGNLWGTWVFSEDHIGDKSMMCGIDEGKIYIQQTTAPYLKVYVKEAIRSAGVDDGEKGET